jgi:hypothetical protein
MRIIESWFVLYALEFKRFPDNLEDINKINCPENILKIRKEALKGDSWGKPFHYIKSNDNCRLISIGPDGKLNTKDDAVIDILLKDVLKND